MPSMRGFLRSKPKIDEAEAALAESRIVARMAGLFGDETVDEAAQQDLPDGGPDSGIPDALTPDLQAPPVTDREAEMASRPRPAIIVIGGVADMDPAGKSAHGPAVEGIGVMARPDEDLGDDPWQLPLRSAPPPIRRPAQRRSARPPSAAQPPARRPALLRPAEPAPRQVVVSAAYCPYCGTLLEPPPTASRRCFECRQQIIVKRIDGRTLYLAAAALPVFAAERRRAAESARLLRTRARWLELAGAAGAPAPGIAAVQVARPTYASVAAARELYLLAADRMFRIAKRDRDWAAAGRQRRDQAATIHRLEGSPWPPSPDVVTLFREGVAAELRGISEISRDAQLAAASCCDACRADDEAVTRIATELRQPRLPHASCPKGLCRCRWELAARDRANLRRYLRRRPASRTGAAPIERPTPIGRSVAR